MTVMAKFNEVVAFLSPAGVGHGRGRAHVPLLALMPRSASDGEATEGVAGRTGVR